MFVCFCVVCLSCLLACAFACLLVFLFVRLFVCVCVCICVSVFVFNVFAAVLAQCLRDCHRQQHTSTPNMNMATIYYAHNNKILGAIRVNLYDPVENLVRDIANRMEVGVREIRLFFLERRVYKNTIIDNNIVNGCLIFVEHKIMVHIKYNNTVHIVRFDSNHRVEHIKRELNITDPRMNVIYNKTSYGDTCTLGFMTGGKAMKRMNITITQNRTRADVDAAEEDNDGDNDIADGDTEDNDSDNDIADGDAPSVASGSD